ncbi:hypothetical protein PPERSA_04088 [Pseudocohnilembus persalinus]|uniref:Uncharacterized protein n=1 Tax=Pseudocohnilembus persalinus TaxID=266149 RepID=A0A0V0QLP8_PSEPJ|nr:hypothetical protein PPERSA_04088 [Pseudocohnilembus persalinus]|eukprot:KRX02885.1 hypothetical protein PPERSA_04088 [Pseudocohnilembus persalinus]
MEIEEESKKQQKSDQRSEFKTFDKQISITNPQIQKAGQIQPNDYEIQEQQYIKIYRQFEKILDQKVDNILQKKFEKLGQKILKIIQNKKKEELAYFINFIFMSVEKTHLNILKEFDEFLFTYLSNERPDKSLSIHRYTGKPTLAEILTSISGEIDQKFRKIQKLNLNAKKFSMVFLFDKVYDLSSDDLSYLAKFMDEEYSDEQFANFQFYFLLPCSSNRKVFISNPSLQIYRSEFCNSEKLINNLILELIKDIRIPLFSKEIFKELSSNYSQYCISYKESARRIKTGLQDYLQEKLQNKDIALIYEYLLDEQPNLNMIPKNIKRIQLKIYISLREGLFISIQLINKILKIICNSKQKTLKLLDYLFKNNQESIYFLLPEINFKESQDVVELAQIIGNMVKKSQHFPEFTERFLEFEKQIIQKNEKRGQDLQTQNIKINNINLNKKNKKQDREQILIESNISSKSRDISLYKQELNKIIRQFIFEKISKIYSEILEKFDDLCYSSHQQLNQLTKPDILQDYVNFLQKEEQKTNNTSILLDIVQGYGREISIKESFQIFKNKIKEFYQEQDIYGAYTNSINELKSMGIIDEGRKFKAVLEKNIFAKTVYCFDADSQQNNNS